MLKSSPKVFESGLFTHKNLDKISKPGIEKVKMYSEYRANQESADYQRLMTKKGEGPKFVKVFHKYMKAAPENGKSSPKKMGRRGQVFD